MRLFVCSVAMAHNGRNKDIVEAIIEKHSMGYELKAIDMVLCHTGKEDPCVKFAESRGWVVVNCSEWDIQPRILFKKADPDCIIGFITNKNVDPVDAILKIAKEKNINYYKYVI